jgi:hypothetical protein
MVQPDRTRLLWWVAAAAVALAGTLELLDGDYLKATSQFLLGIAFTLLATRPESELSRTRAIFTYTLVAVSIVFLFYRVLR